MLCFSFVLAPSLVVAQVTPLPSSGSLVSPRMAGISVEQPQLLPPEAGLSARPLAPVLEPPAPHVKRTPVHRIQPPVNFRLVSAEEPLTPAPKQSLRLAPRGEHARASTSSGYGLGAVPSANSPATTLVTVGGSLAAVVGVFLIVAWCTRRLAPPGSALLPKEAVELLGRSPLTGRQQLQLLRIGNKLLLLAFSPAGVETLTEITEPAEIEHLLSLCRRGRPGSSSVLFQEALTQLASEPAQRGFVASSRPTSRGGR